MNPLLKLTKVPLDGIPSLQHVGYTPQLGVVGKVAEGALIQPSLMLTKMLRVVGPSTNP